MQTKRIELSRPSEINYHFHLSMIYQPHSHLEFSCIRKGSELRGIVGILDFFQKDADLL